MANEKAPPDEDETDDLTEYWPRQGQRLFVPGSPGRDAEIAISSVEKMYWMKEGFKNTADLLVNRIKEIPGEQRQLVWPIVFCYRQYIELALKDVIAKHGGQVEPMINPIWDNHRLGMLWKRCKSIMGYTLLEMTTAEIPEIVVMEALIEEFERVDAGSTAFRYPSDNKGNEIEFPIDSIDLVNLQQVMAGVCTFLDCNEEVLRTHLDGNDWLY